MKKVLSLLALIAMPALTYAYYGESAREKSDPASVLVATIIIVWAILNIILFFKVWGMTNDVRHMKNTHDANQNIFSLKGVAVTYFTKKDLYGQEAATNYLKEIIEKKYQSLGAQPIKGAIDKCNDKLRKQLGVALDDASLSLPTLDGYVDYQKSLYGEFVPGAKVRVRGTT